ncbi:MAG: glycosyltransferase family 2 protein [Eubacteriales bacterium]|nr:glycosyltransferase family 2 protein [Eubacteriales bacterium]
MTKPIVSVIMPAYNCAGTICKAVDSVLAQKVDLELIVIDDGSQDGLENKLAGYKDNPAVCYIKNEKNMGAAASRNRGIAMASGEYVAFLDADDWWEPGKLQKQISCIEKTETILCCTARELVTLEGEPTGKVIPVKEIITYQNLLHHNSINCSSVLIKSDIIKQYEMVHEDSHEDYILWLEILKKHQKACGINEPLLKYRLSAKGKSGNKLKSAGMTFKVYRYAGFGIIKSIWYFCCYAIHGIWKYFVA